MTAAELWKPNDRLGTPIKVGEWSYNGLRLAVRLFKSDVLYRSGDESDDPEVAEDQIVECYSMEFQGSGENRWSSMRQFLTLEDVERFGREDLGDSLCWYEENS